VLEEITFLATAVFSPRNRETVFAHEPLESRHFISDLAPPGTWVSSQTFRYGPRGTDFLGYVGHGIAQSELPDDRSTAMHDLVVGLLCFDEVFVPLKSAYKVHDLVTSGLF